MRLRDNELSNSNSGRQGRSAIRRRMHEVGTAGLSDEEILSLVLGRPGPSDQSISLKELTGANSDELSKMLGDSGAERFRASVELGRRTLRATERRPKLSTPDQIYRHLAPEMAALPREVFYVLCFNARNVLLRSVKVAEGTSDSCAVDPRDIFAAALGCKAVAMVLAHNHPSGDAEPSENDRRLTWQLDQGARLLNIRLMDHLVLGDNTFVSMLERGMLRRVG